MAKITKYEAAELVFTVPVEDGRSVRFTSAGIVETCWKAGDEKSVSAAYGKATDLGTAVKKALGNYEDNLRNFDVRTTSEDVCEHCGSRWTEDSLYYNGGCCAKDQDAEDARTATSAV